MSQGMTDQEARQWCERHGVALRDGEPDARRLGSGLDFSIPQDAGARVHLSQMLYPTTWDIPGAVLTWTGDWGVWPSGEHIPLFTRFRQALGETRDVSVAGAQLFDAEEADDGKSMLMLHCLFLWDCWVVAEGGGYIVHVSHDEWGKLFAEPTVFAKASEYLIHRGFARPPA